MRSIRRGMPMAKFQKIFIFALLIGLLPQLGTQAVSAVGSTAQTITFSYPNDMYVGATQTVAPTSSSGLSVTLTSRSPSTCTVSGFVITGIAVGSCGLEADQAGDATYAAAGQVIKAINIVAVPKTAQAISFAVPSAMTVGGPTQTVAPTASSGLAVTLRSGNTSICTVAGFVITAVWNGTCPIYADQAGDATYSSAASTMRGVTISGGSKTTPTLIFAMPSNMTVGGTQTVAPTLTDGSTSLTLSYFGSSTPSQCTVSGFIITAVSAGTCTLAAGRNEDAAYYFVRIVRSFTVSAGSTTPTTEEIAAAAAAAQAAAAAAAQAAAAAAAQAAAVEAARVRAVAVVQAKAALNTVLAGNSAPTIEQYRAADYTITTQASFDRITAAVAKLPVEDRQDATKIAALIKAIQLDESFFNISARPSVETYSGYGVPGVTARTLPTVNAQVLQLPVGQRGDVAAIQQIAAVESFVDQIANPQTRGSTPAAAFVTRGLVAADNPYKDSLIAATQALLTKLDEASVNTLAEIAAVIARVNAVALKLPLGDRSDPAKITAAITAEAQTALNSALAGSSAPTIEQFRSANYAITTQASFDRISAALAKLPVADRQDGAKLAALIKAIELDESFFNASARPSTTTYTGYGVAGVTERTLPSVNAQVLLLPAVQRADVVAIQKIAEVENFADQIANPQTRGSVSVSSFISRGLIAAENPFKESIIAGLMSFDEYSLNSLTKVVSVINAINAAVLALPADERSSSASIAALSIKLAGVQTFVDRVSNSVTRPGVRSSDFIVRKLMSADTPYKYSVVVGLQSYAEGSLNSMEKIATAIKTEINKAQQRRALTAKIKASIAAKRR